ncbi:MAG: DUF3084 domain-containing protein [Armatimonadota bacterium]|nr:DUF3084 domain-containing protein [Armatimonadota bacterium]
MFTYTTVLVAALAVLGALIAYLGDLLGAWLGKRRSTIFGLRPRRSARLMAAVVGALLPLIGLTVATMGSRYARVAVFELQSLLQRRKDLEESVADLRDRVKRAQRRAGEAEEREASAEADAKEAQSLREDAEAELARVQEARDALKARRDELEARVADLLARREALVAERDQAQLELSEARDNLEDVRATLNATREQVKEAEQHVANRALELKRISDRLQTVQRRLEPTQRELEAATEDLAARQQELEDVEAHLREVLQRQELMAEQRAAFEPGAELIRFVASGDETQDQLESTLYEYLHIASAVAEKEGVPEGENGRSVIAVAPIPPWALAHEVPETMIVRHVAEELREGEADEYVVMIRAFRRWFEGDEQQLAVQFKAAPNRLVFTNGQVLDELLISSELSALEAFEALWLRITDERESRVRARAIEEGMLPHPTTGNYGSVDLAELFTAAEAVSEGVGMMRVRVMAAQDTFTRGPLLLDISVEPAGESP